MIYLFIIFCAAMYFICNDSFIISMGVSDNHLVGCLTYHYAHLSWLHLLINSLSLSLMFSPVLKLYQEKLDDLHAAHFLCICLGISSLSGLICAGDTPTVGASGIVFCLLGMLIMLNPTIKQLKSYIYVAIAIVIQLIGERSNVPLHTVSFVLGALFIILKTYGVNHRRLYQD